ncbi:DUF4097 family beta strand repeat-containing protein [uncultured Tenacibaculum sp.]|uniref:DUF4097 family beta strand repeat-containing protein n=1 Tax=uncultured Tenacibaculum sp. TaxID=174713 RepID=UPI00263605BB|nr:DUF4097 family beta strand repeat-containing protein [uncultured Tenacibaculum sp.]
MKTIKISLLILFLNTLFINAQYLKGEKKYNQVETIKEEYQFLEQSPDNIVVIDNVYGSIDVEGYNGKTIKIEVVKKVSADTKQDVAEGMQEIGVKSAKKGDAVYIYMDSPYSKFDLETGNFQHHEFNFGSRRNYKHRKKRMYKYRLDFKVKVPKNVSIDVKAINKGNITVDNVHGKLLIVHNVNGAIDMTNVSGQTDVNALNKDINITYAKNPTKESWFKSLNGDINVLFKNGLNAEISYKTMNGNFYTNFDVEKTEPQVSKIKQNSKRGVKYKLNIRKNFKIGNGKIPFHFDQLNGDAIVKK